MTLGPQITGKVIFDAEDRTATAMSSINSNIDDVRKAAQKATKEIKVTAAQQQTALGAATDKIRQATDGLGSMADEGRALRGALGDAIAPFTAGVTAATAAVVALVSAARFAEEWAANTRQAEQATARLQVNIEGARAALGGYVDDMTIARVANKGFALGVVQSGDDLAKLAAGVRAISEDLGEDPTQLLEDAIVGIGRKSSAILDNLGITLTAADAEQQYAAMLGKTTDQLSAYEKSQAFSKVAIDRIASAAREGTKATDSFGDSAAKARVEWKNFQQELWGFEDRGGRIREVVRGLDDDVLKLFGSDRIQDIRRIERALMDTGVSYDQIKRHLADINNIDGLKSRDEREKLTARAQLQKALNALAAEGLQYQEKQTAEAERLAAIAEKEAQAKANAAEAEEMDHQVALLQAMGASEQEIIVAQTQALELRIQHAEAAEDLALVTELQRKLELLLVGAYQKKNKARGRGVSQAERITAAGERELQILDETIARMRILGQLRGTEGDTALGLAELERKRRLAALDLEQRALEVARAKNSVERQRNANRLEAIEAERELILLEQQNQQREEANRLVGEAVALSTQRAQAETAAIGRAAELDNLRIDHEAEIIELRARSEADAERNAVRRVDIEADAQAKIIDLQRARLEKEYKAEQAAFDAREAALRSQSGGSPLEKAEREEQIKQLNHDREIARLSYEMDVRRSMEAEKANMASAEQARFDAQIAKMMETLGQFEGFRNQTMELVTFFSQRNAEAQDAAFERQVNNWRQQGAAQKQQLDAQIKAAEGNVALQNRLRQQQARQEQALQKQIEKAQARHQDRKKRQEMRAAGAQLMITAAVESVKAVAAFAGQNYIEGAMHIAAATIAGIKGGMLLSGKIPGGGAEANMSSSAGMAANDSQNEYVDPSKVPGSTPGEAARREAANDRDRPQNGGGTVINFTFNGDVMGTMDQAAAANVARQIENVAYARER